MRISGLSSGMDVEQLMKDIMTAERIPVDRVFQQKVRAEWKRDAYRDANTKLLRLRNMAFDMSLQGTYQNKVATSSHANLIQVTATGRAQEGSFDLKVISLAEVARFSSAVEGGAEAKFESFMGNEGIGEEGIHIQLRGHDGESETTETIHIAKNDSLENVLSKINSNKNLGISTYYDEVEKQVSFTTKATGANAKIEVLGEGTKAFFTQVFGANFDNGNVLRQGKNAEVEINGILTQRESNTFDLSGLTLTLKEKDENTTVRIEARQDTDTIVDKIKEFVNLYNELVDEFNASIREEAYRDFPPLTPEQRAALSDKEIEQWEEKAKSGILRSDRLVGNILTEMRMALGATVQGLEGNKSMSQIGIKTGAWYEHGRLYIDEDKLRKAVEEDPDGVRDIFTKQSEVGKEQGLARRLTKVLDSGMGRISDTAGKASIPYDQSYLGEQIREYEKRLSAMEERLIRVEQMNWDKFTAMERVLGQLYAQSDWLTQQLMAMMG